MERRDRFRRVDCICSWSLDADFRDVGDKSNHVPAMHIPQVYYFIGFSTAMGWPVLLSGAGGLSLLFREVRRRMFGSARYASDACLRTCMLRLLYRNTAVTCVVCLAMTVTIRLFTCVLPSPKAKESSCAHTIEPPEYIIRSYSLTTGITHSTSGSGYSASIGRCLTFWLQDIWRVHGRGMCVLVSRFPSIRPPTSFHGAHAYGAGKDQTLLQTLSNRVIS
jgi:hypothetical protein